jgi:copper transport protein
MLLARWRQLIAVPLFAVSVPVPVPFPVAHEALRRSVPADGASLTAPPTELRLTFRAPVALERLTVELHLAGGRRFELGALRSVRDSSTLVITDVREPLDSGGYVVTWRATSADGHPVTGTFKFTVLSRLPVDSASRAPATSPASGCAGHSPDQAPCDTGSSTTDAPAAFSVESTTYVIVRWLTFASIVLLVGVVLFDAAVLRSLDRDVRFASVVAHARESLRTLALVGAIGTVTTVALKTWAQREALRGNAAPGQSVGWDSVFAVPTWTAGLVLQLAGGVAALVALVVARRRAPSESLMWLAVLAALAPALGGHAIASSNPALGVTVDIAHVIAAAAWVGGVAAIALAALPAAARAQAGERADAALAILGGFSRVALVSAGLLALTGSIAAWMNLTSLGDLTGTRYGFILLVKVGLVAAMALLGALNWRRLGPMCAHGSISPVRRSALVEVGVATLVLVATAILVATALPNDT